MRNSKSLAACLLLTVSIVLFYWRLLLPSQFTLLVGGEDTEQAYSWFNFWIRSLHSGHLPLWDPYSYSGYSFPGELQTGVFYPLYLLLLLLPLNSSGMLTPMQYHLVMLVPRVLAGLFMFALVRDLRLSRFAAFLAGFSFAAGAFIGRCIWPHLLHSAIWFPLILLFLWRACRAEALFDRIFNASLSGLFLGLSFLAGGLNMTFAQGLCVLIAIAFYAFPKAWPWSALDRSIGRRALAIAAFFLFTAGAVSAIQFVMSHEYASRALRWFGDTAFRGTEKPPYVYETGSALSPSGALFSMLFPSFEGKGIGEQWEAYVGVLPFLFAAIGLIVRWSNQWVRYLAAVGIAALLYTMADFSALHSLGYFLVPFLWLAREATRFIYVTAFAISLLSAFGLDACLRHEWTAAVRSRTAALLKWIAFVVLFIFAATVIFAKPLAPQMSFSLLVILATSALAWFQMTGRLARASTFMVLASLLLFFDLTPMYSRIGDRYSAIKDKTSEYDTLLSLRGVVDFLRRQPQPFRVRVLRSPNLNIGDAFGIPSVAGAGVTFNKDYFKIWGDSDLLNVKYLLRPATAPDPNPVYQDGQWKLYANPTAYPRAWLVHQVKFEPNDDALHQDVYDNKLDLRRVALTESPMPLQIGSDAGPEQVSLRSYSASGLTVDVETASPALLVMSENFYPGWHATVNRDQTRIFEVDGSLRAIAVPAGSSTVVVTYRPWGVYIAGGVSLFGLCIPGVLWMFRRLGAGRIAGESSLAWADSRSR